LLKEALRAILHTILFHRVFATIKPKDMEILDLTIVSKVEREENGPLTVPTYDVLRKQQLKDLEDVIDPNRTLLARTQLINHRSLLLTIQKSTDLLKKRLQLSSRLPTPIHRAKDR
jgi:hypothetical protein